ncbi:MAG: GNAT family N-acetyltransferase [Paracoccaceae bacterium]
MNPWLRVARAEELSAAARGDEALSRALGCAVTPGWAVFSEALAAAAKAQRVLEEAGNSGWGTRFVIVGEPPALVGWGGFKSSPDDGDEIAIGYALAPAARGRGYATAAVRTMLAEAFADPRVRSVTARTEAFDNPSTRVLERCGFRRIAEAVPKEAGGERGTWLWRGVRPEAS